MLYGDRDAMRKVFVAAFGKASRNEPMSPMEEVIAAVIAEHPEYHEILRTGRIEEDYTVERGKTNPFLHMGMHIAIREQVSIDRPPGIAAAWRALCLREGDPHRAEHLMLDCLAETLVEAQREGTAPDEVAYLDAVRRLAGL